MKQSMTVVLVLLILLTPAAVAPEAHAAPSAKTTASAVAVAPGIYDVHVTSHSTRRTVSLNSACNSGTWIRVAGSRYSFNDVVLQAVLNVWVATSNNSIYCGYVYSEGDDRLLNNCHRFDGYAKLGDQFATPVSQYQIYHCTHTEYTFTGGVAQYDCPSGHVLFASTSADDPWQTPVVYSPYFWC